MMLDCRILSPRIPLKILELQLCSGNEAIVAEFMHFGTSGNLYLEYYLIHGA